MLADAVRRVRTVADLTDLFRHLGYEPDDGPFMDGWSPVARWRTFRVIGTEAADPAGAARGMARRLAATAQPGLVAAVGSGALALAAPQIGLSRAAPVLVILCRAPSALDLELLRDLRPRSGTTVLQHAFRIGDVLGTETVGERFFAAFRALLERVRGAAPPGCSSAERQLLALLPLTRVLFLYFVQAKGWLDGRSDFLPQALDDALAHHRDFHRTVLHPLFFGTLNRPAHERTMAGRFGRIPYLNGGLFEPHPVERRVGPVVLRNALWRDAFDEVFERFRFCAREGDHVAAIAPDMLGRVFERVMDPTDRQASGTFYTPQHLVRDVVTAALVTSLADEREFPSGAAYEVLAGREPSLATRAVAVARLRRVRLLDPAVGSGAFLLGALDLLTQAWNVVARQPVPVARLRRRIIRHHLYGVDLNPIAVRLAELRLWLAVVADDPQTDVARVTPLPNLNGILRQGDTLLDPLGAAHALGIPAAASRATQTVLVARQGVFHARGPDRARALAALRTAELDAARDLVATALERTRGALGDLVGAAWGRDLFGRRAGLTATQRMRHAPLRAELRALRAAARRVADGVVPFFAFEIHHPEAMRAGGFTVVVGNPPWVRAERLPRGLRTALTARFRWWRTSADRGFCHQPDLAVAFLERALELIRPDGAVGFLVPSKVASSGYAGPARTALVRETTITYVHRVSDRDAAAFGAAVYPLAVVARKAPPPAGHQVALDFERSRFTSQDRLAGGGPWLLIGDRAGEAVEALRSAGPPLGSVVQPALGVKTGADRLLVGAFVERRRAVTVVRLEAEEVELETEVLRPALRGRDVGPFTAASRMFLFWPYDGRGTLRTALPPRAAHYVRQIRDRLTRRTDYRGGPLWTLFRTRSATAAHRVVWPDIARRPAAVFLDAVAPDAIPLNTCYVAPAATPQDANAITTLLNSTWVRVLLRVAADEARGGYRRHNTRSVAIVPVPSSPHHRARLARVGEQAHDQHDVSQTDLDTAVADALGLAPATRADLLALARDLG